jgi:hypothetical protein
MEVPAAIVSIQTAGEFLNWNPHLHVLAPAGAFRTDGSFARSLVFDAAVLRDLFQFFTTFFINYTIRQKRGYGKYRNSSKRLARPEGFEPPAA